MTSDVRIRRSRVQTTTSNKSQNEDNEPKNSSSGKCKCCVSVIIIGIIVSVMLGVSHYFEKNRLDVLEADIYMKKLVEAINANPNARWKARLNPFGMRPKKYSYEKEKNATAVEEYSKHLDRFFNTETMQKHIKELEDFPTANLPRRFDAREQWPQCPSLHIIPHQGGCGSCFAVASVGVTSDRACIQSNGTFKSQLSVQDVLGCCKVCGSCYGGDALKVMLYWVLEGIVTGGRDGCIPYAFSSKCGTPCSMDDYPEAEAKLECRRECQKAYYKSEYENDKKYASIAYTIYPRSFGATMKMAVEKGKAEKVQAPSVVGYINKKYGRTLTAEESRDIVKKELFMFGPTTLELPITEEFLHYESGVFYPLPETEIDKRIIFWHVVRLIGWGYDHEDNFYWTAINSNGYEWGESGIFHIDPTLLEQFGLEFETALL